MTSTVPSKAKNAMTLASKSLKLLKYVTEITSVDGKMFKHQEFLFMLNIFVRCLPNIHLGRVQILTSSELLLLH